MNLQKLTTNNLIALQVERTDGCFLYFVSLTVCLVYAIGNVIVSTGIVIYPMVVDGNESSEYSLVNDLHDWESPSDMVLAVLY